MVCFWYVRTRWSRRDRCLVNLSANAQDLRYSKHMPSQKCNSEKLIDVEKSSKSKQIYSSKTVKHGSCTQNLKVLQVSLREQEQFLGFQLVYKRAVQKRQASLHKLPLTCLRKSGKLTLILRSKMAKSVELESFTRPYYPGRSMLKFGHHLPNLKVIKPRA